MRIPGWLGKFVAAACLFWTGCQAPKLYQERLPKKDLHYLLSLRGTPNGHFIPVPLVRQATDSTCGAASFQSLLGFWGENLHEGGLAEALATHPEHGTNVRSFVEFVERRNREEGSAYKVTLFSSARLFASPNSPVNCPTPDPRPLPAIHPPLDLEELKQTLRRNVPVMVLIQAWGQDSSVYSTGWDDGHYVLVVGYDSDDIFFMDPMMLGNYGHLPKGEFLARWHDYDGYWNPNGERCPGGYELDRFALVLERAGSAPYHWTEIARVP